MNDSVFKVKGFISLKDLMNFNYETMSRTYLLFSAFMLVYLISEVKREGVGLMIILLLGLVCAFMFSLRYNAKRTYKANNSFQSEFEYNFSPDGVNIISDNGNQLLTWNKVYKITESKQSFSIYLAKRQAFLLPKNWFKNEDDIQDFSKLLLTYLPKNKIKRKRFFIF